MFCGRWLHTDVLDEMQIGKLSSASILDMRSERRWILMVQVLLLAKAPLCFCRGCILVVPECLQISSFVND